MAQVYNQQDDGWMVDNPRYGYEPINFDPIFFTNYEPREQFRKLWSEHAVYTKFFINSTLANLPDIEAVSARLLQNQRNLGDFVGRFIGSVAGSTLTNLLTEQITSVADSVRSVKIGDKQAFQIAMMSLAQNSRQISMFISSINMNKLPPTLVLRHFNQLNKYVVAMTIARLKGNYQLDLAIYDKYFAHILFFSDFVINGLMRTNAY